MQLLMCGLGGILILLTWRFMLKKSVLDDHRDKLFDLRDSLRATFVTKGWGLESPIYGRLRNLINSYLRFTDHYSFWEFTALESGVKHSEELQVALKERVDKKFATSIPEQQEFVKQFRREAVSVMMSYMIVSSGPLVIATFLLIPVVACFAIIKTICSIVRAGGSSVLGKAVEIQELLVVLINLTIAVVASWLLIEDFVEEYSYQQ
jgi:hypothetical protein